MRPHIKIATPCFGGQVGHLYMLSVVRLLQEAPSLGFDASLALLGGDALVARARATLVAAFLDAPEATHLLFIDADLAFEPQQVARLLAADREFTAAFYPLKTIDWARLPQRHIGGEPLAEAGLSYVGLPCRGAEARRDGRFVTAVYAGGGFQLLRRTAIERMIAAYPETHFAATNTYPPPPEASQNLYALFDSRIDPETGLYLSEDYAFCQRWRAIGGEIWLDLDSRLTHTGPHSFAGAFSHRSESLA